MDMGTIKLILPINGIFMSFYIFDVHIESYNHLNRIRFTNPSWLWGVASSLTLDGVVSFALMIDRTNLHLH